MWHRLLVAAALTLACGAQAAELGPAQGQTVMLGNVSGVVYYTVAPTGYRVVATFGSGTDTTKRFIATLLPDQDETVSVPRGPGQAPLEATFSRHGDSLSVTTGSPQNIASADHS